VSAAHRRVLVGVTTDKKIAIGVAEHTRTTVESQEMVPDTIRRGARFACARAAGDERGLRLGRERLLRRVAYKCVFLVLGTNITRRELSSRRPTRVRPIRASHSLPNSCPKSGPPGHHAEK
jgi:hypothetical protein